MCYMLFSFVGILFLFLEFVNLMQQVFDLYDFRAKLAIHVVQCFFFVFMIFFFNHIVLALH